MERFIAMLASIDIFNIVMTVGLICLAIAIYRIDKDTKVLRERNRRERQRESKRHDFQDDGAAIVN